MEEGIRHRVECKKGDGWEGGDDNQPHGQHCYVESNYRNQR